MLTVLLVIAGVVVAFVIWRYCATAAGSARLEQRINAEVQPVLDSLREGRDVPDGQIEELAKRTDTRSTLYRALLWIGRLDVLPALYGRIESIAESDLVHWLMHPSELNAVPSAIELTATVEREEGDPPQPYRFFVFRYRDDSSRSTDGGEWLAGVAGPYLEGQSMELSPPGVFSRFERYDSKTPEEHVTAVEEMILGKRG